MRKLYITTILTTLLTALSWSTNAQDGFTRRIEIEKEFSASVDKADRIEVEPRMLDTTIVRPAMIYAIKSTAHQSEFGMESIKPIEMSTAQWTSQNNYYLNAGAGYPYKSEVDFVWTPLRERGRELEIRAHHDGAQMSIVNPTGPSVGTVELRNMVGVEYGTNVEKLGRLDVKADYRGVVANPYALAPINGQVGHKIVSVNGLDATVALEGAFSPKSPLSYRAAIGGIFALNSNYGALSEYSSSGVALSGHYDVGFNLFGLDSVARWMPTKVGVLLNASHWTGRSQGSVIIAPEWNLRVAKYLPLSLSVGYDIGVMGPKREFAEGIVGSLQMAWVRNSSCVPYLSVSAERQSNLVHKAMLVTPTVDYINSDARKLYDAHLGVKGNAKVVGYNLRAGARHYSEYYGVRAGALSASMEGITTEGVGLYFEEFEGVSLLYAAAEVEYQPLKNLRMAANVEYRYLLEEASVVDILTLRPLEARLGAEYALGNRWFFLLEGRYASSCGYGYENYSTTISQQLPAYVDLGVRIKWRGGESWSAWLQGDNLLNQHIYYLPTLRKSGVGARIGAEIVF